MANVTDKLCHKWQLVYYYYKKWGDNEHFDLLLAKLRECIRIKKSQNREASLGIIVSQRIRWGNNRFLNGYDGNKKIKGITSHVVVDQNGFLLAMMVTVANIHDSKAAFLLMRVLKSLLCNIKVIIADGEIIEQVKNKFGYIIQVIVRSGKKNAAFEPINKRWIVERTFAWFDNDRRLCRNYELLIDSPEYMTKLSAIKLLLNKI